MLIKIKLSRKVIKSLVFLMKPHLTYFLFIRTFFLFKKKFFQIIFFSGFLKVGDYCFILVSYFLLVAILLKIGCSTNIQSCFLTMPTSIHVKFSKIQISSYFSRKVCYLVKLQSNFISRNIASVY